MTLEQVSEAIFHDGYHGGDSAFERLGAYLAEGGDVNAPDPVSGWTLLHKSCEHQNYRLIQALAEVGADLNAQEPYTGWTPLHVAVDIDIDGVLQATRNEEEFRRELTFSTTALLLSLGADANVRNHKGEMPRDIASHYGADALQRYDGLTSAAPDRPAGRLGGN